MPKQAKLPGSFTEVGPGKWRIVVSLGFDGMGKRRQVKRIVEGNQTQAAAVLAELLHKRNTGVDLKPDRLTVGQYLDRWLKDHSANIRPPTARRYKELINLHVVPSIGRVQLKALKPAQIRACYRMVVEKGLSSTTAHRVHAVLRQALEQAVGDEILMRNPTDVVKAPQDADFEVYVFRQDELELVLQYAEGASHPNKCYSGYYAIFRMAMDMGMREGELFDLRWAQIDLDAGTLSVKRRSTKTDRGVRLIRIPADTVAMLRGHRRAQAEHRLRLGSLFKDGDNHGQRVFPNLVGGRMYPSNFRRVWVEILHCAGVDGARFHDLRHSHATLLLQAGVPLKVVSERLGHSSIGITGDTYQHVLPQMDLDAAAQIDKLFGRSVEPAVEEVL